MNNKDNYDNSYLRKVAQKRSPEDLFTPQQSSGMSKLIMPIVILLLIGIIAYLLLKNDSTSSDNSPKDNTELNSDLQAVEEPKNSANSTSKPATIGMYDTSADDSSAADNTPAQESKDKTTATVAKMVPSSSKMSQEDLAKIAQMVVAQMKKTQQTDNSLANSLSQAQIDTLQDDKEASTKVINGEKVTKSNKTISHYNKVAIKKSDDSITKGINELEGKDYEKKKSKYTSATSKELSTRQGEMRFHTVKDGETLSGIAIKVYGNAKYYKKIFNANPDILRNANMIYVGQKLRVPE